MTVLGVPILDGLYPSTMDLYPLQAPEFNRIHPFYENLKQNRFTTTRCKKCGSTPFPPRVVCPKCNSDDMEWVDLPTQGKVLRFTEEVAGVPHGFTAPLIHGLVDLGEGRKLITRIVNCKEGELKEGATVKLSVFDIPAMVVEKRGVMEERPRVFFAFEPVK